LFLTVVRCLAEAERSNYETKLTSGSRRQYIFQLEKWGVQKYNKRCELHADEVQPRDRPSG
jgi:hypothetical protein